MLLTNAHTCSEKGDDGLVSCLVIASLDYFFYSRKKYYFTNQRELEEQPGTTETEGRRDTRAGEGQSVIVE